jgi:hypothetical protein
MSNITKTDATLESQKNPLEELAAELAVDVEALEERLEMVAFDALTCCIINGYCPLK